ncbi:hypothetical protein Gpo141_00009718 [Globisporangium polare]
MATRTSSLVIEPVQRNMLSTSGFCGVRGVFFEPVVMLREVIEIAIQTAQAYQCSRQTAKFWVNASFAILIIVNCYSSPLLHKLSNRFSSVSVTRVAVLVVDLALDLVWFAVIPSLIWFPYLCALMHSELVMYGDTYIIEGIMELPVFFVTSYLDLLVKLWPPVSIYFTMRKIELLTRRARKHRPDASHSSSSKKVAVAVDPKATSSKPRCMGGFTCERVEKWLSVLLLCWAHTIAIVYIYANFVVTPPCSSGCQLVLRPWFQSSATCQCAALELNCLELGIEGSASQIQEALSETHVKDLLSLMLTHCPALNVPPAIRNLNDLYGLVLLNCTLESWDDDAAITSAYFPHLSYVNLVHTPVLEVPKALLHTDLPPSLYEIDIIGSNLTKLPDNVDEMWSHLTALLLEDNNLSEYPMALTRMPALEMLSLYDNQIAHIPDNAFLKNARLRYLLLAKNPLVSLPKSLGSLTVLFHVLAMWTNIEDVYTPLENGNLHMLSTLHVFGFGSPMCSSNASSLSPGTNRSLSVDEAKMLECHRKFFTYKGGVSYGYYPYEPKLAEKKYAPG